VRSAPTAGCADGGTVPGSGISADGDATGVAAKTEAIDPGPIMATSSTAVAKIEMGFLDISCFPFVISSPVT